jgi:2-dehydropantoate 2-reductase
MKIVVIGAGAIGGVTAAFMSKNGVDVTLVCKHESIADTIRSSGLHIVGKRGEQQIKLKAVADISELSEKYDFCLIATKAYDLVNSAERVLPYLVSDGLIVSLQNGICIDALANVSGIDKAVGAVITWSSTMLGDATLEVTGEGVFIIGMTGGPASERLKELMGAMCRAFPTTISDDIISEMYSKLIINSGITCGGAMTGQTLGKMLAGRNARRFFISIVREDMRVAQAMGLKVPPFGGKLDYYSFINGNFLLAELKRHLILFAVGLRYRKLRSSSLTSLMRGGKTEVDYLNGWIAQKGRELGIPTPVNDQVVSIIKEIESGKRKINPRNLLETL